MKKNKKIRCPYCKQWCFNQYSFVVFDVVKHLLSHFNTIKKWTKKYYK